ncbi:S-layer homology domain-containing protein [Deinococcus radiomollis]|uniref:S-layer homology domain-containing protein n=1 Tax=Deinococcus radiomollis TaxID=468916 RepID=UPI003892AB1D
MQIQKNKMLTIASTLTLALGVAGAQTAPATTPAPATAPAPAVTAPAAAQVNTFKDVPAGHWAKDAVDLIVQKGLIQGFPDGTFRGNENLTRYQAALIFYRLLQSGALSSGSVTTTDTTTIANGMQEVATELASISSRVTDLETLTADQQTRIAALEAQIATLNAAGTTDNTALTARIDALETAVRNIPAGATGPAGPQGPAGTAANTTAIEARLAALEARVATQPATTTSTSTTTNTTTNPSTIVIGDTTTTAATTASNAGRLYVGANYNYSLSNTRGSYGAVVGTTQAIGPVGAQVSVDYEPVNGTINADATATLHLNAGGNLSPYAGLGFGLTSSKTRSAADSSVAATTGSSTDYSVGGLVGVDYRFTDSLGVYAEAQGRYYITNNGIGTGLQGTKPGFGSSAKAGLKFFF